MSRAQQMAADPKQILHRTVDRCEALQMAGPISPRSIPANGSVTNPRGSPPFCGAGVHRFVARTLAMDIAFVTPTGIRRPSQQREVLLVIPLRDEGVSSVEDPCRNWPTSRIPHTIGFWRDAELGSECGLREFQRLPTLAKGLRGHGRDHSASRRPTGRFEP